MNTPFIDLQNAVEKFLRDTSVIPPWESAGAIWLQRIQELQHAWLNSKGIVK